MLRPSAGPSFTMNRIGLNPTARREWPSTPTWIFILLLGVRALAAEPAATELFEHSVRPLLVEQCQKCHGAKKPKGGLDLTSRAAMLKGGDSGPAVVPGKPDKSLLVQAVRYLDTPRMPPRKKLADRDIAALNPLGRSWCALARGSSETVTRAKAFTITDERRRFWSFQPVRRPAPPAVRDGASVGQPHRPFRPGAAGERGTAPAERRPTAAR